MIKQTTLPVAVFLFLLISFVQLPRLALAEEPVLLTLEFSQSDVGTKDVVSLTYDDLAALPWDTFETTTNWTDGQQHFAGPSLYRLLREYDVNSGQLELVAINDYGVLIPVDEIEPDGPIIAIELNGQRMSVREKGPLWLIYNYDADPANRTETIYSRSIWQLDRIFISR